MAYFIRMNGKKIDRPFPTLESARGARTLAMMLGEDSAEIVDDAGNVIHGRLI